MRPNVQSSVYYYCAIALPARPFWGAGRAGRRRIERALYGGGIALIPHGRKDHLDRFNGLWGFWVPFGEARVI